MARSVVSRRSVLASSKTKKTTLATIVSVDTYDDGIVVTPSRGKPQIYMLDDPFFAANLILSSWKGARAGKDPWDAWTLEWSVSSPPPAYNFASIPTVSSRRPLWDLKHPEDPDSRYE